jgi:D-tyrosyl-tRNA(Tyr) deacylase
MIALLQRVTKAAVDVEGRTVARSGRGLLVFIGVERGDHQYAATRLVERILGYRVFADGDGRMNLSLQDIQGDLLLVPQFTLAANTSKGMRPSFSTAARPEFGEAMFDCLVEQARSRHSSVSCGQFGADMQVSLTNDGPVTFLLRVNSGGER